MSLAWTKVTQLITLTTLTHKNSPKCETGIRFRAEAVKNYDNGNQTNQKNKKVVVLGSGWSGLSAAHHLCNQGFDVKVLEGDNGFGGLEDIGQRGFWHPYKNIFNLVDELGIKPFTKWTKSAQYSEEGLEVEFPIFQDMPQWPTPLGTLFYTQFVRLPLVDRLTLLPLMAAAIDFDNTDIAWRKYDSITARELFKQFGCSERLYKNVVAPLLQVGLFAPAELCSAAATLSVLSYYIAHQKNFDMVFCNGTIRDKIFKPWMDSMIAKGCEFVEGKRVTDLFINEETGCVSEVVCGRDRFNTDAVIIAAGISPLQHLIQNSAALNTREEFCKVLKLDTVDVLTVKLWFDRRVNIPNASNACSGSDDSFGWTFFDLNVIQDEHRDNPATVLQADFYYANELLAQKDDLIVSKVTSYLSKCIKDFENAVVVNKEIKRFPKSLTHFFPGSYKYMTRVSTSFPNLFMAGDWIISRHGSWSQEKSYVTGLEAANLVVDHLEEGNFAKIIPIEEDEPHIEALRSLNRRVNEIRAQLPLSGYFL